MGTSQDIHTLRRKVTARDKALASSRPFQEAVKYICERYRTTQDSASAFVAFMRGSLDDGSGPRNPVERWHTRFDEMTGEWVTVTDEPDEAGEE